MDWFFGKPKQEGLTAAQQTARKWASKTARYAESFKQCAEESRKCALDKLACEISKEEAIRQADLNNRQCNSDLATAKRRLRELYNQLMENQTEDETKDTASGDEAFASAKSRAQQLAGQLAEARQNLRDCRQQQKELNSKLQSLAAEKAREVEALQQTNTTLKGKNQSMDQKYAAQLASLSRRLEECASSAGAAESNKAELQAMHDKLQQEVRSLTAEKAREVDEVKQTNATLKSDNEHLRQKYEAQLADLSSRLDACTSATSGAAGVKQMYDQLEQEVRRLTADKAREADALQQTNTTLERENQHLRRNYEAQLADLSSQLGACTLSAVAAASDKAKWEGTHSELTEAVETMKTELRECRETQQKKLEEGVAECKVRVERIEAGSVAKEAELKRAKKSVIALEAENTRLQSLLLDANQRAETAAHENDTLNVKVQNCETDLKEFQKTREERDACRAKLVQCKSDLQTCNEELAEAQASTAQASTDELEDAPRRELAKWREAVGCDSNSPCDEGIEKLENMVRQLQFLQDDLREQIDANAKLKAEVDKLKRMLRRP